MGYMLRGDSLSVIPAGSPRTAQEAICSESETQTESCAVNFIFLCIKDIIEETYDLGSAYEHIQDQCLTGNNNDCVIGGNKKY